MAAIQFAYVSSQADLARAIAARVLSASDVLNAAAGMQSGDAQFVNRIIDYVSGQLVIISTDGTNRAAEIAAGG